MSLPSTNADVNIILNGQDNASIIVEDSVKRTNRAFSQMRNEQRAVARQFELNNRGIVSTMRAINTLGNIAQRGIAVWQAWTLSQIRLGDAQRDLRDIQKDLAEAIASGDIEAQTKLREDEADAIERVNQVQNDNILGYIAMGLTIASMASNITTKALPALAKLKNGLTGVNTQLKTQPKSATASLGTNTQKSTNTKGTGTKSNKIGGTGLGKVGGIGLGGGLALGGIILDQVSNSDDPVETLKQLILDPLNFKGKKDDKIIINVQVGNEIKQHIIDVNNPYAVS